MRVCWQITWNEWHKICYAEVSRWLTIGRHRCRWVLLSFHAFVRPSKCLWAWVLVLPTSLLEEKVFILACWCIQMTCRQFIYAYEYHCQPVRLFTTFSGYCAFADKSLWGNCIKFGMLKYPYDLPSVDIDADGNCCRVMRSSLRLPGREFFLYCGQISR